MTPSPDGPDAGTTFENWDWELAARTAARTSGAAAAGRWGDSYHRAVLERDASQMMERAHRMAAEETGLPAADGLRAAVVDRAGWVERSLAHYSRLLSPLYKEAESRLAGYGAPGSIAKRLMMLESGAVLGLLSRRVLGQYELVLPSGDGDSICLVAPNILEMERRRQFRPDEFRFWVCLHESAHRLQFTGVPWLRSYFIGMVQEASSLFLADESQLLNLVSGIRRALAEGRPVLDEAGLPGLLAGPRQREVLNRIQALMSLLEGHGHAVMDRIGARCLVSSERMSRLLSNRRREQRLGLLLRLAGLEMKLKQYETGAAFISHIERRAGWDAVGRAWESAQTLPTLEEIEDPDRWLARVA